MIDHYFLTQTYATYKEGANSIINVIYTDCCSRPLHEMSCPRVDLVLSRHSTKAKTDPLEIVSAALRRAKMRSVLGRASCT